ncbi:hypothetical protein PFISCL1PPCAC_29065, partial [Pristionchus fissidentatus]
AGRETRKGTVITCTDWASWSLLSTSSNWVLLFPLDQACQHLQALLHFPVHRHLQADPAHPWAREDLAVRRDPELLVGPV